MSNSKVVGRFHADCFDANGDLKWTEDFDNVVTDQGKKFLLDTAFNTTNTVPTMTLRMGYIATGTPTSASTYQAPVFGEATTAVVGNTRTIPAFGAASGTSTVTKVTSAAVVLTLVGAGTVSGISVNIGAIAAVSSLFIPGDTNTAGVVQYSAGLFSAPKIVSTYDVLNVTYSTSLN